MRPDRVKHILKERLDNEYIRTLCGRVIPHLAMFINDSSRRKHKYLAWPDNVDCQDCLRTHFKVQGAQ